MEEEKLAELDVEIGIGYLSKNHWTHTSKQVYCT